MRIEDTAAPRENAEAVACIAGERIMAGS